jgi:hypothetical protein
VGNDTISRQRIIDALSSDLKRGAFIRAAWLGGSDSSGRADQWSDVDIQLIVEDNHVEEAFDAVHKALEALSPIDLVYRFPTPTWHGHEQEMIRLRDASPFAVVDLVVMNRSNPNRFLEAERHGHPLVLFDHDDLVRAQSLDWVEHAAKLRKRLHALRLQFEFGQVEVRKAALRGAVIEAAYLYQALCVRPLVELLRMRYCPERFDYGPRYLDRDLPDHARAALEALALPPSIEALERLQDEIETLFRRNAEELGCRERGTRMTNDK